MFKQKSFEKPIIRREVLDSPEIQKIFITRLIQSFDSITSYLPNSSEANNANFINIIDNLEKISFDKQDNMNEKIAIFESLANLYLDTLYGNFSTKQDIIAQYIMLFYTDKNHIEEELSSLSTIELIFKDFLTLGDNPKNKKIIDELIHEVCKQNESIDYMYYTLITQKILDSAAVNAWRNKKKSPIQTLFKAVKDGDLDLIMVAFKENKEYVRAKNDDEHTLLHVAILKQNPKIVKFLVENGADLDTKNAYNLTPYEAASRLCAMDRNRNSQDITNIIQIQQNKNVLQNERIGRPVSEAATAALLKDRLPSELGKYIGSFLKPNNVARVNKSTAEAAKQAKKIAIEKENQQRGPKS